MLSVSVESDYMNDRVVAVAEEGQGDCDEEKALKD